MTPRDLPVDYAAAAVTLLVCLYLLLQLYVIFTRRHSPLFRPKQPGPLMLQTTAAIGFAAVQIFVGHHFSLNGLFSLCTTFEVWAYWSTFGLWLSCQVLRVHKILRVCVREHDIERAVAHANARLVKSAMSRSGTMSRARQLQRKYRHELKFVAELAIELAPWLVFMSVASALRAVKADEARGTCVWARKEFVGIGFLLVVWPLFRIWLLGREIIRVGAKAVFTEFRLLRRGFGVVVLAIALVLVVEALRNYTDLCASEAYRVTKRLLVTGISLGVVVLVQHWLIGPQVLAHLSGHVTAM